MPSISSLARAMRVVRIAAVALCALLLLATFGLIALESTWVKPSEADGQHAYLYTSTGTENVPLAVMQVLPDMFPEHFQPRGPEYGDWIQQFGFTRAPDGTNEGMPIGFAISNHRPGSGSPSPVSYVGFTCGMCHTARVQTSDADPGVLVIGMGSPHLDFIAWVDAFKDAVLDEQRLSVQSVNEAYQKKYQRELTLAERAMISIWLPQIRQTLQRNLPRFDEPFGGKDLLDSGKMPNGPSRTQPFRNLVRNVMDRPATLGDYAYCKIPTLYEQGNRHWGQYDGSVGNRLTRSVMAAIAVGANKDNLNEPEISKSVIKAVDYTVALRGPRYADVFKEHGAALDPTRVERGRTVYMKHCYECHGIRDSKTGQWEKGRYTGEVVPVEKLGTDAERVTFRHFDRLPDVLYNMFPDDNPLKPKREDIRPGPAGSTQGYINAPIETVWSRAPFLHNGSVPTLAELINLKPRRELYYRGRNLYDPVDVGLVVSQAPDARNYYRFDTGLRGNSNKGHDYPWAYGSPERDEAQLKDLLEFLKTLD
ncbi:hypothetical protein [Vitiosangium sp. GDMCC 1.1324]|uniref:c-type cytochrome n=1 Tax=Vitiosangium sp. (strain GDMCC 1.1324) TaxID=2138576 RepID=UPI000D3D8A2C|nr:hypothetical protein [Vitiosangium sp. GDMCC 1.1324]PTL85598.1 hypothetical protein DAT35_02470 [Vitiosangium sp. GDMCC 1.1324]